MNRYCTRASNCVGKAGYLQNAEGIRDSPASFTVWLSRLNSCIFNYSLRVATFDASATA